MMESIKSRLAALENTVRRKPIPTEREFWEMWESLDPLTKSLFEAIAEAKIWETEPDEHSRRYLRTISEYLISAGVVTEGQSVLDLAAELEAQNVKI